MTTKKRFQHAGLIAFTLVFLLSAAIYADPPRLKGTSAVPVMTSNTSPSGQVSASSYLWNNSSYAPWHAFDGTSSGSWTLWISGYNMPQHIDYTFPEQKIITRYYLMPQYSATALSQKNRSAKAWQLLGLNTYTSEWEILDEREGYTMSNWPDNGLYFNVQNPGRYWHYRLKILETCGSTVVSFRTIQLYEPQNLVPEMTSNTAPHGIASASTYYPYYGGFPPWKAFDNGSMNDAFNGLSHWMSAAYMPQYLTFQQTVCPNRIVAAYYVAPYFDGYGGLFAAPKSWKLQGSNGTTWVTLDEQSNFTHADWDTMEPGNGFFFYINNPASYLKYRLYITASNGPGVAVQELKLFLAYSQPSCPMNPGSLESPR